MENLGLNKPTLTVVIEQDGLKQEFTMDDDIFNSFEDACEALKQFIESYRR